MTAKLNKKISPLLITEEDNLTNALKQMDVVGKKLLIVMEGDNFKNVLSIGDIQRHLIKTQNFDAQVKEVLRDVNEIKIAYVTDSVQEIKEMMLLYRTEFMPIIDTEGKLKNVLFWDELFEVAHSPAKGDLNLQVVIMAGGKGTRLKPITNIIPKPLIPLGEKPIMEMIMDRFVEMGAAHFFISVNYKSDMIANYFNSIENRTYGIDYFTETKPLGTAGSLHLLKDKIQATFFVSNCDIIIEQDYSEIYKYHKENKNELTLVAAIKHYKIPYGTLTVAENGLLTNIKEKPEFTYLVNAGMYIIEPHLLKEVPENEFFHITHLMEKILARNGRVGVFPVSEKSWADIGEWKEYKQTLQRYGYQSW